jgi:hypothetical protein
MQLRIPFLLKNRGPVTLAVKRPQPKPYHMRQRIAAEFKYNKLIITIVAAFRISNSDR